jgi:hypothetical protein
MIKNIDDLKNTIKQVNTSIQEINNFIGPDDPDQFDGSDFMIGLPIGYIRTAEYFRQQIPFIKDKDLSSNIAYTLQLSDFYCWLFNRTNIDLTVREMLIKNGLMLMASICETIAVYVTKGIIGKSHAFCARIDRMITEELIDKDLAIELKDLWTKRKGIHLYELDKAEFNKYKYDDYSSAVILTHRLIDTYNRKQQGLKK